MVSMPVRQYNSVNAAQVRVQSLDIPFPDILFGSSVKQNYRLAAIFRCGLEKCQSVPDAPE
jgi:hypothetical protein